jgi:hypothetical protein
MLRPFGSAVMVLLLVGGCTSVETKPVEVDVPTAERHFIVILEGHRTPS